jgi:hypothetical protein
MKKEPELNASKYFQNFKSLLHATYVRICEVRYSLKGISYVLRFCPAFDEVITGVTMEITVFWYVTPCTVLHKCKHFSLTCYLQLSLP